MAGSVDLDREQAVCGSGCYLHVWVQDRNKAGRNDVSLCLRQLHGEFNQINERHRNRYTITPDNIYRLHAASLVQTMNKGELMEIVELKDSPWSVSVQYTQSLCPET